MRINSLPCNKNFGRALTSKEKNYYNSMLKDAKSELGIKDTEAIVFDFNVPSEFGKNLAIGSSWSASMENFTDFLKAMVGITSVQVQPQGKIVQSNHSPYSGTNFAFGSHIIDLQKLTTDEYANILPLNKITAADVEYPRDKKIREYHTDYDYVIGTNSALGKSEHLLTEAYENFNLKLSNGDKKATSINEDFTKFKSENSSWLEKEALFEILKSEYSTSDISRWNDEDRLLYSKTLPEDKREKRINSLVSKNKKKIDFENFKQFIAFKQQKESHDLLNSKNIKLYGDCLIGFAPSEIWGNPDCFRENLFYGGPDPNCPETNNIQTWGLAALDYTKLGKCSDSSNLSNLGSTGEFLYDKYSSFFKKYDGIRMDAAWQFVTPFIYEVKDGQYSEVKLPEIDYTIFNIMNAAAKDVYGEKFDEKNPENIMLELVGMSADKSRQMTLNTYPHLYTTAYAEYGETPAQFKNKGYQNGMFYTGVGCHDNDSLVNSACDVKKRNLHLAGMKKDYNLEENKLKFNAENYKSQTSEEKAREDFRTAKFAEIFTSSKQFFTLPDMFGMSERINISGKSSTENWTIRIPSDYEKFYYSQLSKGFGLNMPKVLSNAMQMVGIKNDYLVQKCNEAAEILRSDGPLTEKEANIADGQGLLGKKFEYLS